MSWYRQYRPQTVAALHITPVREAFARILDSGQFSHAYLLYGPKGTGKTSGARILAKVLNCERNRKTVETILAQETKGKSSAKVKLQEPCNECATCLAITAGQSLCVTEMDAASNRGIDDIRELTSRIGLSSGDGIMNVIIVDEVHMLTTEAFNALLKVLEEPPAHVVFVLATTERQKVPETIVSRCQVITYRKALDSEIAAALNGIAGAEKIELEESVVSTIAKLADGSLRDGVKLFEQVAKDKAKVSLQDVQQILGESTAGLVEKLIAALAKRQMSETMAVFTETDAHALNMVQFQKDVLTALHKRMVEAPQKQSPYLPIYIQLLKQLNVPLSPNLPVPHLPFEVACLEWCLGGKAAPALEKHVEEVTPVAAPMPKMTGRQDKKMAPAVEVEPRPTVAAVKANIEPEIKADVVVAAEPELPFTLTFADVIPKWHIVLRQVKDKNLSLEAIFRGTKPLSLEGNVLRLEASYKFHKDQLELDRNLRVIEAALKEVYGQKMRLSFSLAVKTQKLTTPHDNISGKVEDPGLVSAAEAAFL